MPISINTLCVRLASRMAPHSKCGTIRGRNLDRPLPAPHEPGRVAPIVERAGRRYVACWPRPLPTRESLECLPWQRQRRWSRPGDMYWQVKGRNTVSFVEWMAHGSAVSPPAVFALRFAAAPNNWAFDPTSERPRNDAAHLLCDVPRVDWRQPFTDSTARNHALKLRRRATGSTAYIA